ncbi:16S rRNA (cytosine(1402)-N(4))-methyltransferase RsmH [bacterium]|nr:16S rRNA (cytosine(1402)-N(4))-methyltransferase RsmH [bacterium]
MHIPVLQKEVLKYLNPKPNENFIDATIGEAGDALAILEKNKPDGKVLGIDADYEQIKRIKQRALNFQFKDRLVLVNGSYNKLEEIVEKYDFNPIEGILFDLGISSWHLEQSGRGFTFLKDEPLDMRYNARSENQGSLSAQQILNNFSQKDICEILRKYGEERFAKRISEKIVKERKIKPIKTTLQLVEIIKKAVPKRYRARKKHVATKTFQALRIAVNNELGSLKQALPQALRVLNIGGRLVVISFHSLEDRIVKQFLKVGEKNGKLQILTKKPVTPTLQEVQENYRSRSAKLRAAIKLV